MSDIDFLTGRRTLPVGYDRPTYDLNGTATPHTAPRTLTPGEAARDVDFGYLGSSSISGFVYVDRDNDGAFDAIETPIPGTTVTLTGIDVRGGAITRPGCGT